SSPSFFPLPGCAARELRYFGRQYPVSLHQKKRPTYYNAQYITASTILLQREQDHGIQIAYSLPFLVPVYYPRTPSRRPLVVFGLWHIHHYSSYPERKNVADRLIS